MRIPKYIQEHIEMNNKLLMQADRHAKIVKSWYENQLDKLKADDSDIPDEEFSDIQENWYANALIILAAVEENLNLLENEQSKH